MPIWHGSNFAEPEIAHEYVEKYGKLWHDTPDAVTFLRWLYHQPQVMVERAAYLEIREALLWEHDVQKRRQILEQEKPLDERLAKPLPPEVFELCTDCQGTQMYRWEYWQLSRLA